MQQKIIFTNFTIEALTDLISQFDAPQIFVIADQNTSSLALPIIQSYIPAIEKAPVITIPADDVNKNLDSLQAIWKQLNENGATRSSLIINLGGGMLTDIAGFAAATFKRGVRFINIPTTLLGAVDASVGGKTGINFNGCKNEIGAFCEAEAIIISTTFFNTLPDQQLLSGYAEMLKHGLLDSKTTLAELLKYDPTTQPANNDKLLALIEKSVNVKKSVVEADPLEAGLRKTLNLGHTAGHAFESFAMNDRHAPIPHGYAVAWGLVVELILSQMKLGFPSSTLHTFAKFVKEHYGSFAFTCDDYDTLLRYMSHDKKNASVDAINFTLLSEIGAPKINQIASPSEIKAALDIFRDEM